MRYVVMLCLLLSLTGCGPSSDDARHNCLTTTIGVWQINHRDATQSEFAAALEQARVDCNADYEANPEAFVATWSG